VSDLDDAFRLQQLIARFANSFDRKDWEGLGGCLSDTIHTDYSDLRGTAPETLSRERFVELRRTALQDLSTHHLSGNIEIQVDGAHGEVKVSMVIYRRSQGNEVLNTHCLYIFEVEKSHGQWTICSIVQKVYWSDGKTAIHPGIVKA